MRKKRVAWTAAAALGAVVLGLAAWGGCGGTAGRGRHGGGPDASDGTPRRGGTLRIIGSSDMDHLDTATGYSTLFNALSRNFARQLFATAGSNTFAEAIVVRPDVATAIPTRRNGGLSADGRTYTIKLRSGVLWNTRPVREVIAEDFIRGIKRLCNPAQPSGGLAYYTDTIKGFDAYCAGFRGIDPEDPRAMAGYQNRHDVSGLVARGDKTLVITLNRPANDFIEIMAMPFASAAPREYDAYAPDGPGLRAHLASDGPYEIASYLPGKEYLLRRNPAWRGDSDPIRGQYVDRIRITLGQDSPDAVQQQLEQGSADLSWDQPVPAPAISRLKAARDPGFAIQEGSISNPYLVFNTLSPNNGGALGRREVRRAIEYAIDKRALVKIYGGPDVAVPLHTVIPPHSAGYREYDLYPTPGDAGDPAECRTRLARAGHPDGLTLRFPYRTNSNHPRLAESVQADLSACGIRCVLTPDSNGDFYARSLARPDDARTGAWDIAAPGWVPDWYGMNGRTMIVPLFDGRRYGPNSPDYGGYDSPEVDRIIDRALQATEPAAAAALWHEADVKIMEDAAIVPFMNQKFPIYRSDRVRNARFVPTAHSYDYTRIWLADAR